MSAEQGDREIAYALSCGHERFAHDPAFKIGSLFWCRDCQRQLRVVRVARRACFDLIDPSVSEGRY